MRFPRIPPLVRQSALTVRNRLDSGGFSEPATVGRCRIDRSGQLAPNAYQLTEGCVARVFIDATEWAGELREGDLVGFDGEEHAVASVARCDHPDGTPHHWEADVR